MKKQFDRLNEHYLIPAVLCMGLLSMAMAFYFFHQWSQPTAESTTTISAGIETKGTVSLLLFLLAFTAITWKNRCFFIFYLIIGTTCLFFIFS